MQAGKPDQEILLYWPVYDVWNNSKGLDMALKVHDVDDWLHPSAFYQLAKKLAKEGYSFDFASDRLLQQTKVVDHRLATAANGNPYQVLVVPKCGMMKPETVAQLIKMAKAGASIIFQDIPTDVPGLAEVPARQKLLKSLFNQLKFKTVSEGVDQCAIGTGTILLAKDVEKALAILKLKREELTDRGLQFIRRKVGAETYYYLVNHTAKAIDEFVPLNVDGNVLILDPQTGATGLAATAKGQTRIQLKSGQAWFLKITKAKLSQFKPWFYFTKQQESLTLDQAWSLHFTAGGPSLPADQPSVKLGSWTALADPKLQSFSGTGVYTATFNLQTKSAKEYLLQLNQVDESARVWINGQEVGVLWSIPFEIRIGKYLKAGKNTIKVEVVNLMANRIRDLDLQKIPWRNYHEINFVNIDYQPFDASSWKVVSSGLIGPVVITGFN